MAKAKKSASKKPQIFTTKDVRLGGIVGGPWAAAYMFYKNFKAINQPRYASRALIIGALTPFVLFGLALAFPTLGRGVVVGLYIAVVIIVVERYQKAVERANAKMRGGFYTPNQAGKVVLIGIVAYLAFIGAGSVALGARSGLTPLESLEEVILAQGGFDTEQYVAYLTEFDANDQAALQEMNAVVTLPDLPALSGSDQQTAITHLDTATALYRKNIEIMNKASRMKGKSSVTTKNIGYVSSYVSLRLEQIEVVKKDVADNTDTSRPRFDAIQAEITNVTKLIQRK